MGDLATFKTYVDLNGNMQFSESNEDITPYVMSVELERSGTTDGEPGYLQVVLDNSDYRFIPQNSSSPYGSDWTLGRRIKITSTLVTEPIFSDIDDVTIDRMCSTLNGYETDLIYAFITNITPEMVADEPQERVTVQARVITRMLELRKFVTGTLLDKSTGEIIELALDTLGASSPGYWTMGLSLLGVDTYLGGSGAAWRVIDDGQNDLAYCSFDESVQSAINSLLEAEQGYFYIRKDGWAVFEDRHHRLKERTSRFTFTDEHMTELVTVYDDEELFNHIEVTAHPRSVGTAGTVVWDAIGDNNGHSISAGQSRDYYVAFTDPETGRLCEAIDVVDPLLSGTDFVAKENADGTGSVLTGSMTAVLSQDDNERYTCTVTNTGETGMYVTTLQVRGTPLIAYDPVPMTAEDETAIARDLQRDMSIDLALMADPLEAESLAQYLLSEHKDPRTRIKTMKLLGDTTTKTEQILNREIGDRVTITSAKYGISNDYVIDGIVLNIDAELERLEAEYTLSETALYDYWILGTSLLGIDTYLAY